MTDLKLGILEAGVTPPGLERFGAYPAMFRRLLGEDAYDYVEFDVRDGVLPEHPEDCDGYIVTGSACGVYDRAPWIGRLADWLKAARGRAALVGICFGHQIMAHAFGGTVIKSPRGWGLGAHRYTVVREEPWMGGAQSFVLPASHQDQVVKCPPDAELVAHSDFTPFGMLAYPGQRAFSLQLHPEFDVEFAAALVERIQGGDASDAQAQVAIDSLDGPMDRASAAGWIRSFLTSAGT